VTTLKEAIAARGLKEPKLHSVKFWNSRPIADRTKTWATHQSAPLYSGPAGDQDLATLKNPPSVAAYVAAWTRLNHLKE